MLNQVVSKALTRPDMRPDAVQVFINCRTTDTGPEAKHLAADLKRFVGSNAVFLDHERLEAGKSWPEELRAAVSGSKILLALMGRHWLVGRRARGERRLETADDLGAPGDEAALGAGKVVVPVPVNRNNDARRNSLQVDAANGVVCDAAGAAPPKTRLGNPTSPPSSICSANTVSRRSTSHRVPPQEDQRRDRVPIVRRSPAMRVRQGHRQKPRRDRWTTRHTPRNPSSTPESRPRPARRARHRGHAARCAAPEWFGRAADASDSEP